MREGGPVIRLCLTVSVLAAVLVMAGCSHDHESESDVPDDPSIPSVTVTLTDAGCQPSSFDLAAGDVVFTVTNGGTTKVKEMEVQDANGHLRGDVEGVQPGQTRSFLVKLEPGATYRVRCPEDAPTGGTITVH
jgi:iron uptake system component EfeO